MSRVDRALLDDLLARVRRGEIVWEPFRAGVEIPMRSTYPGPYYGKKFSVHIVEISPEHTFSWKWHPGAPDEDISAEPMTLVTFTLEDAEGGVGAPAALR